MARKYRRSAQQFFSELLGRDPHSQRMKALYDIDRCYNRLSSILSRGIFDPSFDEERYTLSKALDDFYSRLKEAVTYNNCADVSGIIALSRLRGGELTTKVDASSPSPSTLSHFGWAGRPTRS